MLGLVHISSAFWNTPANIAGLSSLYHLLHSSIDVAIMHVYHKNRSMCWIASLLLCACGDVVFLLAGVACS